MAGQPASKAEQLGQRMQEFVGQLTVTDLEVAQLRREANGILASSPDVGHMVLGFLAALEGDESGTKSHFNIATKLNRTHVVHINYTQALNRLNLYSEALTEAQLSFQLAPSSISAIDNLVESLLCVGAIVRARDLLDVRRRMHPGTTARYEGFIVATSHLMSDHGVTDGQVGELQTVALNVLREHRLYVRRMQYLVQGDDDSSWASVWLHIQAPVDAVVGLNLEYCDRLAAIEPPVTTDQTVGYMFVTELSA